MTRRALSCCAWSVLFFFLFTLFSPDDALCFDTDTLKTAGIVTGITIGAALVIVLVVGTVRDMKRKRGDDEEDDDVWTQSPVLRTLGYRHEDDPLFGRSPVRPEGPSDEGLTGRKAIEAFLEGRVDAARVEGPHRLYAPDPRRFGLPGGLPAGGSPPYPEGAGNRPPAALRISRAGDSVRAAELEFRDCH